MLSTERWRLVAHPVGIVDHGHAASGRHGSKLTNRGRVLPRPGFHGPHRRVRLATRFCLRGMPRGENRGRAPACIMRHEGHSPQASSWLSGTRGKEARSRVSAPSGLSRLREDRKQERHEPADRTPALRRSVSITPDCPRIVSQIMPAPCQSRSTPGCRRHEPRTPTTVRSASPCRNARR